MWKTWKITNHQKIYIKTTIKYHLASSRKATIKSKSKLNSICVGKEAEKLKLLANYTLRVAWEMV